jgi:hypothetical protein
MFRTNNCSSSGALKKYSFNGAHQDLRALNVTRDKTSFLAADYMKYGDLIGEMAMSLRREGSNQKLMGIRNISIIPRPFTSNSFLVCHSLIAVLFGALYFCVRTASLNNPPNILGHLSLSISRKHLT